MSFTKDKESDNYATDKKGWEIIKNFIPKDKIIWAPFYCDGKQKEYFKEMGFDIIHEDKDFFSYTPEYDLIIDNPPYSKWLHVCNRLKELDKPFIIIAKPNCFLTKKFQNLFKEHLQLIIPNNRPTFTHLTNNKKKYTPPFGTWYICYKMNFAKDLNFI
jgi:hypothetical protein|tara:strand:+ start:1942 stop:2418 length:477 start_codon:yes stop_codon:yes gene_type:complete